MHDMKNIIMKDSTRWCPSQSLKCMAQIDKTRSLPQSRFRTGAGGVGAGAPLKGTMIVGLPGPIPEG